MVSFLRMGEVNCKGNIEKRLCKFMIQNAVFLCVFKIKDRIVKDMKIQRILSRCLVPNAYENAMCNFER